jgi:hypothetical protein
MSSGFQLLTIADVVFTAISYIIASGYLVVNKPLSLVKDVWPYLAIMGAFTAFVVMNGGVVLGMDTSIIASTVSNRF